MGSRYGENHGLVCRGCGLTYDAMRTGMSFKEVRNMIITIGTDTKTGKTKYGRRHGVLGYFFELKQLYWEEHVGACEGVTSKRKRR